MNSIISNVFVDDLISSMKKTGFKLEDFDFTLPDHYIARTPRPFRSAGRLMHVNRTTGEINHGNFRQFADFFNPGDLLVFNNSRIIPSRLIVSSKANKNINLFVERILSSTHMLARIFKHPKLRCDDYLTIGKETLKITLIEGEFYELELIESKKSLLAVIYNHGDLAFPTYFEREATQADKMCFQNIYAKEDGSVSAPSAGFHFDESVFEQLTKRKINIGYITLHVGSGTSAPIHVDDISKHKMHTEWFHVSDELCTLVKETKQNGNKVIAIGTTSLRALETASQSGEIMACTDFTDIFIQPGYQFQCIDGLFTNLHLPRSTLMILISAFAGYENIKNAYQIAIEKNYRFLAYGDGMLVT